MYENLLRPLLFRLDPERAHHLAKTALRHAAPWKGRAQIAPADAQRLHTRIGGLEIANPVGLSAGFDKNAEALAGLNELGFGYLTVGSICPTPRSGNPRPRLMRLPQKESLLNCYGLPSDGLQACLARLRDKRRNPGQTPVVANIDSPDIETYLASMKAVEPYVHAIEIGTQCPNNRDDEGDFNTTKVLEDLLRQVMQARTKPVFVKILPYQNEQERLNRLELAAIAAHHGADGITVPGTWREQTPDLSLGYGQASGRMVLEKTLRTVADLREATGGRIAIKANGGIATGEDAFRVLAAGASSVDVLCSFVYRGWNVARLINAELLDILKHHRIPSVRDIGVYRGIQ